MKISNNFKINGSLFGMIHLQALPGAPQFSGNLGAVLQQALHDAETLQTAGVDGIIIENFGDVPFVKNKVAPETVAVMTMIADRVSTKVDCPIGINVLRNDGISALSIARAIGGAFIRVNVLAWARLTDQGMIEGQAAELQRYRALLGAQHIMVFADVSVKHSSFIAPLSIEEEACDVVERALADAIIITGPSTSASVDIDELRSVAATVDVPVLVGSGVTLETAPLLRNVASAAIVGSAIMQDGRPGNSIDSKRACQLVSAWRQGRA